jgi:CHAT domain-containing protein/tetratricopeptide (TPR) repeat protein
VVLGLATQAASAQPATPANDPQKRFEERDRLQAEAARLRQEGKLTEAVAATRKMLALERGVLGEASDDAVGSLELLAELHEERDDFAAARTARAEVLAVRVRRDGDRHWRTANARRAAADTELLARMGPEQRRQVAEGRRLNRQVEQLFEAGKLREGVDAGRKAVDVNRLALGAEHPAYAQSVDNLAVIYGALGDSARALPLFRQALALRKKVLGEQHPDYAQGMNNLATLYHHMGEYARASPLYRQALVIDQKALGEEHPDYATALDNLASVYQDMGDLGQALPLLQQALQIRRRVLGEQHPRCANALNSLALLYEAMGDYRKALPLFQQARAIDQKALGEEHPDYAIDLNNLAELYRAMDDSARALPLYQQALAIEKKALGEQHPDYASCLNNLGLLYQSMGDYPRALPLLRQALEIRRKALGEQHPEYALSLNNLAALYRDMGDPARALPRFEQALEIQKKALGEEHPAYATALYNLGSLYREQGDSARAEPLLRRALEICRANLELTAATQSERQQLAMTRALRVRLDAYLDLAAQARQPGESAYLHVLAWKGAVFLRQRRLHLQRQRPGLADTVARLDHTTGRLAALALAAPGSRQQVAYRRQVQELTEEKERLEADLARRSAGFQKERELARLTPRRLQQVLLADTALVDFLEYTHSSPPPAGKGPWPHETHLAAFVVRPRSITQLDLGPAGPIAAAVDRWRQALSCRSAAGELRRLVWAPLQEHLRRARTVLVSPDGALARVPFVALPGADPGKHLIEELAVAVVPVPQLLPELLDRPDQRPASEPSLLLVGDVDFGGAAGLADTRGTRRSGGRSGRAGALPAFPRLEATREELLAVGDSFRHRYRKGAVTELRDEEATEAAVRQQAPKHRYLHFATHGFFAPPSLRSALGPTPAHPGGAAEPTGDLFGPQGIGDFHPELMSGLVLAGANRPAKKGQDDGILTALEVAELDLRGVDLAVLSACETGLGEEAGGEGLLGLQRAFQVAGAKSVVASLWKVDDDATRKLMARFYENLWRSKQPLGKLEALRQAQLWMVQSGVQRGLVLLDEETKAQKPARTPPYYWAAFTLSGDWR